MSHKPSNHCGKCKLVIHNRFPHALYCKKCADSIRLQRQILNSQIKTWQGLIRANQNKLNRMYEKTISLRLEK